MIADAQGSYLRALFVAGLMVATSSAVASAGPAPPPRSTAPAQKTRIVENYGKLPLSFEANLGQVDKSVEFLSRGSGYELYLTGNQAALRLCKGAFGAARPGRQRELSTNQEAATCDVLRMHLTGASDKAEAMGEEKLPGTANYFIGKDPAKWHTSVSTYARVRYTGIYPGTDLVYYGNQRQLEFDFVVAPNADPRRIRLRFSGSNRLHLTADGDLAVATASGTLVFQRPLAYQLVGGQRLPVAGAFALLGKHTAGFRLAGYDRSSTLVIDPVLAYSTFLGGTNGDIASAIAVDSSGDVYVAGGAFSTNFPVTPGAFQTTDKSPASGGINAFVTKLNPTGTALLYSTYLGGSGSSGCGGDAAYGLAVDSSGNAYVTGSTCSTDFPVTQGAYQTTNKAVANSVATAFVAKLNSTGAALVYSTYLGGSGLAAFSPSGGDEGNAITVDAAGAAYVAGRTYSTDFPVTQGAYQTANHATASGGANAFITKLSATGTALVYSTLLGGSGGNRVGFFGDVATAIVADSSGDAYVTGQAGSADFPVTAGAYQTTNKAAANEETNAFVTEVNPTGSALVYSTYLGGSGGDRANAIAVDSAGNAYVAGAAASTDFPVTQGAFQTVNHFGFSGPAGCIGGPGAVTGGPNAFITKLNAAGTSLIYSTYLGGSGGVVDFSPTLCRADGDQVYGLAIDGSGGVYVTGFTASGNFPVTQGAYQTVNNDFAGVAGEAGCTNGCIGGYNAFITELNSTGSALLYSTYLGGNGINPNEFVGLAEFGEGDLANALALDSSGNLYLTGVATSYDFPVIAGAFQMTNPSAQSPYAGSGSPFVAKLNMNQSSSPTLPTVTVTPASPTITSAQPLSVTISVSGPSGAATPTGIVTLASGTYPSAPATLSSGSATIDVPGASLTADSGPGCGYSPSPDILSANYLPDADSSPAYKFSSALKTVEVLAPCVSTTPGFTTVTWAQSQSQPFSLAIFAAVPTGSPVPTGTVTLTTGSYSSASATLTSGTATISIPSKTLILGDNYINVAYSGDSNYAPVPYASLALIEVTNSSAVGFVITSTPVIIKAGATTGNTSTITVEATGGFVGDVTLAASVTSGPSGAQYPPAFSFGSTSPVLTGGRVTGLATLTIVTTAPSGGCSQAQETQRELPWYTGGGATLACIVFFGIPASRRKWRAALGMLALLMIVAGGMLACGGAGGSPCNSGTGGTTPGTYTITVSGTSGPTAANGTVTLTVQ